MTFVEFFGFLVSLFALIFLFLKKVSQENQRRQHPEEFKEKKEMERRQVQEFYKALGIENALPEELRDEEPVEVKPPPPAPKPVVVPQDHVPDRTVTWDYQYQTSIEKFDPHSKIEDRYLQPKITDDSIDIYEEDIVSEDMEASDLTERAYEVHFEKQSSKVQSWIGRLDSKRDLLVAHEIFGKPKGLRSSFGSR